MPGSELWGPVGKSFPSARHSGLEGRWSQDGCNKGIGKDRGPEVEEEGQESKESDYKHLPEFGNERF